MPRKEREKALLAMALVLVFTAGWWAFFHTPLRASEARWQAEGEKAHAQLIEVQNYKNGMANGAARQKEQKEKKRRHAFLADALPDGLEQGAFLGGLERLALACHLELAGVKPAEALERPDGLMELPVTVTVRGDYFSLLDFLQGLDAQKAGGRFVLVRGLSVRAGDDGGPLSATLQLSVFATGSGTEK